MAILANFVFVSKTYKPVNFQMLLSLMSVCIIVALESPPPKTYYLRQACVCIIPFIAFCNNSVQCEFSEVCNSP